MDSSEWELSKENVQPIKQGRKLPNLTAALTPCGVNVGEDSSYWKLQKYKQNFEAEIRTYEGDDFLDVWYRYILWTEENVPKGGRDIGTLLERCIKEFQDVAKYENDERYLNVWLKYADCCSDPLEIFNYLHTKGTCSRLALLYIGWASACENVENFQKADQVLMLGIEKNAQPLESLQKYHIGFQHRLASHIAASQDGESECGEENQRKALGSLMMAGSKTLVGVMRTSSTQNPTQSRTGPPKQEKKGLGFAILHDSEDSEHRRSLLAEGPGNEWKEAPTESAMSKENVNMPGKWTGDKDRLRRPSSSTVVRPAAKQNFQVHVDEDAEQVGHVRQTVSSQVLSARKSESETSNDPLKVLSNSAENSAPSNVKVMYDKSKVYGGAEEFQFEEIQAAKYMMMLKQGLPLPKDINRLKREQNPRPAQPEKRYRVMYPKTKVYAYEGEFQLEEVMARLYYERGNRLIMPQKRSDEVAACLPSTLEDVPALVENHHSQHAATNVTLRSGSRKTRQPRNAKDFHAENGPENAQAIAQDISMSKSDNGFFPQHSNVNNFNLIYDAENMPPPIPNSRGIIIPYDDAGIPPPTGTQSRYVAHDYEDITPPPQRGARLTTKREHERDASPPTVVRSIDAENIPPPRPNTRGLNMPAGGGSISPPSGDVENLHIYHDPENIPPRNRNVRDADIWNSARGVPPTTGDVRKIHIYHDDAENISPPHRNARVRDIANGAGGMPSPSDDAENFHIYHDAESNSPPNHKARGVNIPAVAGGIHPPNDDVQNLHIYRDPENDSPPNYKTGGVVIPKAVGGIHPPNDAQNLHIYCDPENDSPLNYKTGGVVIPKAVGGIHPPNDAQNLHIYCDPENDSPPNRKARGVVTPNAAGGIHPPRDYAQNLHIYHDAENIHPPHRGATMPDPLSPPSRAHIADAENVPPPNKGNFRSMALRDKCESVSAPDEADAVEMNFKKAVKTPDFQPQSRGTILDERSNKSEKKNSLAAMTPKFAHYKPDLTGPSPTLTTKEAFADVMPWFNTTVGLGTSDVDLENEFKNDENDDELDDMGWCGIPFGDQFGEKFSSPTKIGIDHHENTENLLLPQTKDVENYEEDWLVSTTKEVDDDLCDENQENLPPLGYNQTKVERTVQGILQPSLGIPFEPREDLEQNEEEVIKDDEQLGNVFAEQDDVPLCEPQLKLADEIDEVTQNNLLDHLEFAAAARLISTPFGGNLSPPKLENLHCSSIQAHDERRDVTEHASAVSESYNANNSKVLSPIWECSDEDPKSGLSKASSHVSGLSVKSSVQTTHSVIAEQTEATFAHDTTAHTSELHGRSMDITVHDMNGTVLNKINPFDPEMCKELLSRLPRPVTSFPGYHDKRETRLPTFTANNDVEIDGKSFTVQDIVGSGGYAKVFSATITEDEVKETVALKVQRPANDWEFYISSELMKRMKNRGESEAEIASVVNTSDYYAFSDGSLSVTAYHKRGTFLDFVNDCKKDQSVLSEDVAWHYALEMMRILECIHDCGIIHGDIKPDNFVLLENNGGSDEAYCRLGLIDFGCAIDMELFPPGTRFSADTNTESFECIEMKTQRPWTTQVDTYGMLCSLHCLIFGEYMKVYQEKKSGRWKLTKSFNRKWNRSLWHKLFDVFLNIPSCDHLPSLTAIRQEFLQYYNEAVDDLKEVFF